MEVTDLGAHLHEPHQNRSCWQAEMEMEWRWRVLSSRWADAPGSSAERNSPGRAAGRCPGLGSPGTDTEGLTPAPV